jgi:hypothetical protein
VDSITNTAGVRREPIGRISGRHSTDRTGRRDAQAEPKRSRTREPPAGQPRVERTTAILSVNDRVPSTMSGPD